MPIASIHRIRRVALASALLAVAAVAVTGAGFAGPAEDVNSRGQHGHTYDVGLFGDVNYGPDGRAEFAALRDHMNRAGLEFSLFDGDLKNGKEPCDDAMYADAAARFALFKQPVVTVPGDNDWTDCHRANNGAFDPIERLAHERTLFYSTPYSLGRHPLKLDRQAGYPENSRLSVGQVTYVNLNVQGSNDNFPHAGVDGEARSAAEIARQDAEHVAREQANLAWLHEAFASARTHKDKGVVVTWQADPDFNNEWNTPNPQSYDGFTAILAGLRAEVIAFGKPVALVHGDGHYFKTDQPLAFDNGQVIPTFTRVETFGDKNSHWVRLTVDPSSPELFSFHPEYVAANINNRK